MICQINGALTFFVYYFSFFFFLGLLLPVDCGLSMWGKMIIPMYRLRLHGLYGLYGPRCPLSPKRPINLISLSPIDSLTATRLRLCNSLRIIVDMILLPVGLPSGYLPWYIMVSLASIKSHSFMTSCDITSLCLVRPICVYYCVYYVVAII